MAGSAAHGPARPAIRLAAWIRFEPLLDFRMTGHELLTLRVRMRGHPLRC